MMSMNNLNLLCSPILSPKARFIFVTQCPCVPTMPSVASRNLVRARHILRDRDTLWIKHSLTQEMFKFRACLVHRKRVQLLQDFCPLSNWNLMQENTVFLTFDSILRCSPYIYLVKELPLHQELKFVCTLSTGLQCWC